MVAALIDTTRAYRSDTPGSVPASLKEGQWAFNMADGIIFWHDPASGGVMASPSLKSLVTPQQVSASIASALTGLENGEAMLTTFKALADQVRSDESGISGLVSQVAGMLSFAAPQSLSAGQRQLALNNLGLPAPTSAVVVQPFIRSGGGPNMDGFATHDIRLGWNGTRPRIAVDQADLGALWCDFAADISFGPTGYARFPNGLMLNWATGTAAASVLNITFKSAFPNEIYGAWPVIYNNSTTAAVAGPYVYSYGLQGCTIAANGFGSGGVQGSANRPLFVWALGR